MKLSRLAKECGGKLIGGDVDITSLCIDSRVAGKGDLFFCMRGTREDSHIYVKDAERRGAAAIVCEREVETALPCILVEDGRAGMAKMSAAFYGHPERKMKMIGVTGTNGKTTVVHMLYSIFSAAGKKVGIIGTLGARYQHTVVPPVLTTPDPVSLFSLLAEMQRAGVELVCMEVSAHALALKKDCPIVYDAAIFTNLTQDHLDFFENMTAYGEVKKGLFQKERCRLAVLNSDDAFSAEIMGEDCAPVLTYGGENPADCFAVIEREDIGGSTALLNLEDDLCDAYIPLTGRHNVYNALAAAGTARRMGVSVEAVARGLATTKVEGRLERVGEYHGAEIFVDFAHTPDGLKKSLMSLKEHTTGKLFLVFGCGGNRDAGKRPMMGETAAKHCNFAVITSDNPRYEDPCAIISEIEAGFSKISKQYVAIEDREKGIAYALSKLKKGDVLLVAGKGGEQTQEIMGIKYAFNDKAVIEALMGK